jgi:small-conductance mechanosensitive channel
MTSPTPPLQIFSCARLILTILAAFAFGAATLLSPDAVYGQSTPAEGIEHVIDAAREANVSIIVLDPAAPSQPAAQTEELSLSERAARLAEAVSLGLKETFADLASAPDTLPDSIASASPDGTTNWVWIGLAITALSLLVGWIAERALRVCAVSWLNLSPPSGDVERQELIKFVLLSTVVKALLIAGGLAVALLIAVSVMPDDERSMALLLAVFEPVVYVRAFLLFFGAILSPFAPEPQILSIPRDIALPIYKRLRSGLWIAGALAVLALWLEQISAAEGLVTTGAIASAVVVATVLGKSAWSVQRAIWTSATTAAAALTWTTRNWHRAVTVYLILAVLITAVSRLVGTEASGLVIAPVVAAILSAILYAVFLLAVDATFGGARHAGGLELPSFRRWAERSVLIIACSVAACLVLGQWGVVFLRDDGTVRRIYTILLVLIATYIGWLAIQTAFNRKIAEERGTAGPRDEDSEEGGAGGTRLATLLPLFRNAVFIAVLAIACMIVLSSIGVDVAPLFAGAGLVGIAIGFGAQTLVRDVFSGVFFLVDDAFRIGEYIDTGTAKGTVEKISIRSLQLRHQNGPLHTIPFGEMTQVTNFSRDWVIMKIPIRVRFGTDTERVRKLIKKLGLELLEHPIVGEKFVEPLKCQGVYQMDELGIVMRVKFKTRPGDQFAARKVVYQKINELFEREGIAFGGREVIVRGTDDRRDSQSATASPEVAAAGAAVAGPTGPAETGRKTT